MCRAQPEPQDAEGGDGSTYPPTRPGALTCRAQGGGPDAPPTSMGLSVRLQDGEVKSSGDVDVPHLHVRNRNGEMHGLRAVSLQDQTLNQELPACFYSVCVSCFHDASATYMWAPVSTGFVPLITCHLSLCSVITHLSPLIIHPSTHHPASPPVTCLTCARIYYPLPTTHHLSESLPARYLSVLPRQHCGARLHMDSAW